MITTKLSDIVNKFDIIYNISPYGDGHINDTYLAKRKPYILQRINTNIFKNPEKLMENICLVTNHLKNKIIAEGGNPQRETLTVIKTKDGDNLYRLDENNCFRMYDFVYDTITVNTVKNPNQLYETAKGFARFQKMLADFPADALFETIQDFHNTPKRFANLKKAIENDVLSRAQNVKEEISFAMAQKDWIGTVTEGLESGMIPLRVTHNDTKINNILFDKLSLKAVCVIDLDTVMPGSMLYDFGDALRLGASSAPEDETDLSKVYFRLDAFEAFSKGYAEEMSSILTEEEIDLLPLSAKLLTFECGIRFLTDYLEGDKYFKIHKPTHNLDRARNQFKLVQSIDDQFEKMKEITIKYFG